MSGDRRGRREQAAAEGQTRRAAPAAEEGAARRGGGRDLPKLGDSGSLADALGGDDRPTQQTPAPPLQAARAGLTGPGQRLPHAAALQRSFGKHDLRRITAHIDDAAAEACAALGVQAYALGEHVAFSKPPSIFDAAHEAAHVVAQRLGVVPPGAAGTSGDAFEQKADAVAALASGGHKVEHLLGPGAQAGQATGPAEALQFEESMLAGSSPQTEMKKELDSELALMANAKAIVAWATGPRDPKGGGKGKGKGKGKAETTPEPGSEQPPATPGPPLIKPEELLANKKLCRKLVPKAAKVEDLAPTFELMVYYGVVKPEAGAFRLLVDGESKLPATAGLDQAQTDVQAIRKDFDRRFPEKGRRKPVVETAEIDPSMSADRKSKDAALSIADLKSRSQEFVVLLKPSKRGKAQKPVLRVTELPTEVAPEAKDFQIKVSSTKVEVKKDEDGQYVKFKGKTKTKNIRIDEFERAESVSDGSAAATVKQKAAVEKEQAEKIPIAEKVLSKRKCYRTFSKDTLNYLKKLKARFPGFSAGTYPSHNWGEFSADIFLKGGYVKTGDHAGFYKPETAEAFFAALEETAKEEGFGWKACYNDTIVAKTVNKKFGKSRIWTKAPNHGPAPDHKLHVHVDFKPPKVEKDSVTGYKINEQGRVVVTGKEGKPAP